MAKQEARFDGTAFNVQLRALPVDGRIDLLRSPCSTGVPVSTSLYRRSRGTTLHRRTVSHAELTLLPPDPAITDGERRDKDR